LVPLSSDLSVEPGGVAHALAPAFMQVLSEPFDVLVGRARPGVGLFRGLGAGICGRSCWTTLRSPRSRCGSRPRRAGHGRRCVVHASVPRCVTRTPGSQGRPAGVCFAFGAGARFAQLDAVGADRVLHNVFFHRALVGRWRGARQAGPFPAAPSPNDACDFHRTSLSGDYCVSCGVGCPEWMASWQERQTTKVLRRRRAIC
jgi:hypothetical protein